MDAIGIRYGRVSPCNFLCDSSWRKAVHYFSGEFRSYLDNGIFIEAVNNAKREIGICFCNAFTMNVP